MNYKKIICTVVNDKFINGCIVMLKSFLEHNDFNGDIMIIHNETYSKLSEINQLKIKNNINNNNIIFNNIKSNEYFDLIENYKKYTGETRLIPAIFKFETFRLLNKYDEILYLDSDILVIDNIMGLFNNKPGIYVAPDIGEYNPNILFGNFNTGVIFINKINRYNLFDEIMEFAKKTKELNLFDQTILNNVLKNDVNFINCNYNCLKRSFPDSNFDNYNKSIKIIHYVGEKPWDMVKKHNFEKNYSKLEKFWLEKSREYIEK